MQGTKRKRGVTSNKSVYGEKTDPQTDVKGRKGDQKCNEKFI